MKRLKSVISLVLALSMVLSLNVFATTTNLDSCIGDLFPDTTVKIAFLGGSITEGTGATNTNNRWASIIANELTGKLSGKTVEILNAGFGGTPSSFGLFRLEKQIMDFQPDLVFVDFAVNDIFVNATLVKQYMENIVQKLNSLENPPYIVFVYMGTKYKEAPKAEAQQEVADYYGIPSINLHEQLHGDFLTAKKAEYNNDLQTFWDNPKEGHDTTINGKLKEKYANVTAWKAAVDATASFDTDGYGYDYWLDLFLVDIYHPSDVGYAAYADFISSKLNSEPQNYFKKAAKKAYSFGREYQNPDSIPVSMAEMSSGWTEGSSFMYSTHPEYKVYTASTAGETLTYYFKGKVFGVIGNIGTDGGKMSLTIDGVARDDVSCKSTASLRSLIGLTTDLSDGWHKAVLTTQDTGKCRISFFATDFPYSTPEIESISSNGEDLEMKSSGVYTMPTGISQLKAILDGYPDKGTFTSDKIKVYKNNNELNCQITVNQEAKSADIVLPSASEYGESYKIVLSENLTYDGEGEEAVFYLATAAEFKLGGLKVTKTDGSAIYSASDIGTQVMVALDVTNFLDAPKDIMLISGLYGSDGILKNAWLNKQNIGANTAAQNVSVTVDAGTDGFKNGDYVKIFAWDSVNKPYIKTVLFTVNDAVLSTEDKEVLAFVLDTDVNNQSLSDVVARRSSDGAITITGTAGKAMNVTMMLVDDGANICYIGQADNTEGGFTFTIKPNTLKDNIYTLYISGN